MKLILIRHGMTEANIKRCYCGATDLPLSEQGIKDLENKKGKYNNIDKDNTLFYTSGLMRTQQTIRILFGDVNYHSDERFNEMNFGEFEMHTHDELLNNEHYKLWLKDVNNYVIPGGESSSMQKERVIKGLKELLKNKVDQIVLITHGGVIFNIYQYLLNDSDKIIYEIQPQPGDGLIFEIGEDNKFLGKI